VLGERVHPSAFRIATALQRLDDALEHADWHRVLEAHRLLSYSAGAEYATRLPTDAELEQVHAELADLCGSPVPYVLTADGHAAADDYDREILDLVK
jgi:flavin-binding protein dodecin